MRAMPLRQAVVTASFLLPAAFSPACQREQSRTATPSDQEPPAPPSSRPERDSMTTPSTSQPSTPGATSERDQAQTTAPAGGERPPDGAETEGAPPSASTTTPGGATGAATTTMSQGQTIDPSSLKTAQVRALQTALRAQGARIQVDGRMGPQTRQALEAFQRRHQLGSVGQLDMATLTALELSAQDFMTAH